MRLLLVGDVMLGRLVNDVLRREPPDYAWGDCLAAFRAADARVGNLECALSDTGDPFAYPDKVFHFKSDEANVRSLLAAGFDAVSVANNHVLDFGEDAMARTLDVLRGNGIAAAGAGRDLAEASRPCIVTAGGRRLGLIAFTDNEADWAATARRPGVFFVPVDLRDPRARHLQRVVGEAKAQVDVLVVSAHWGPNWGDEPPAEHVPFAHALVDAGADVIFGHSGHVTRGIESYRGRPILYCTGDFVDDYAVDPVDRNDRSFLFEVHLGPGEPTRIVLRPTVITDFHAQLARDPERGASVERMRRLCAAFGTPTEWRPEAGELEVAVNPADRAARRR